MAGLALMAQPGTVDLAEMELANHLDWTMSYPPSATSNDYHRA